MVARQVKNAKQLRAIIDDDPLWKKFNYHLMNEGLTEKRRMKLRAMYGMFKRNLRVTPENAERADIEEFINRLNTNKIHKHTPDLRDTGLPLSGVTKMDEKKFIKQFYKWLHGNNEFYPPQVAWIRGRLAKDERPKEKEVVALLEVQRLAEAQKQPQYTILTLIAFDSGFRIGELLSMKKRDLTLEPFDEEERTGAIQRCYWVTCRESKTLTRKVPIPLFTNQVAHFVQSDYYGRLGENDLLFSVEYPAYLKNLKQTGYALCKKKITPHALRHSSATYYARAFEGNMNMIAERYGWTYSSKELATYIRKSGAYQKPQAKKIFTNDVATMRDENQQLKGQLVQVQEQMEMLQEQMRGMQELMTWHKEWARKRS